MEKSKEEVKTEEPKMLKKFNTNDWAKNRNKRRALRQDLFAIRVFIDNLTAFNGRAEAKKSIKGEKKPVLEERLKSLKAQYEKLPKFTEWKFFPERWDIGDPDRVRMMKTMANKDDKSMVARMEECHKYGLDEIVLFGRDQYLDKVDNSKVKDWRSARIKKSVKQAIDDGQKASKNSTSKAATKETKEDKK